MATSNKLTVCSDMISWDFFWCLYSRYACLPNFGQVQNYVSPPPITAMTQTRGDFPPRWTQNLVKFWESIYSADKKTQQISGGGNISDVKQMIKNDLFHYVVNQELKYSTHNHAHTHTHTHTSCPAEGDLWLFAGCGPRLHSGTEPRLVRLHHRCDWTWFGGGDKREDDG